MLGEMRLKPMDKLCSFISRKRTWKMTHDLGVRIHIGELIQVLIGPSTKPETFRLEKVAGGFHNIIK